MPFPLPVIAGIFAAGAIAKAVGATRQAEAQKAASLMNKQASLMKAAQALDVGKAVETTMRFDISRFKGAQLAAMSSSGAVVGSGSAATAELDTAMLAELEVLTVRNNATMEAWGHKTDAQQYQYQADVAAAGGGLAAGLSLITGGAQIASIYT